MVIAVGHLLYALQVPARKCCIFLNVSIWFNAVANEPNQNVHL